MLVRRRSTHSPGTLRSPRRSGRKNATRYIVVSSCAFKFLPRRPTRLSRSGILRITWHARAAVIPRDTTHPRTMRAHTIPSCWSSFRGTGAGRKKFAARSTVACKLRRNGFRKSDLKTLRNAINGLCVPFQNSRFLAVST